MIRSILSRKIREFKQPQFATPSTHFSGIKFTPTAEEEYCEINDDLYERVNELLEDIWANGLMRGKGKPEFRTKLAGKNMRYWRRKINDGNRLLYRQVKINGKNVLEIFACKGHYKDH